MGIPVVINFSVEYENNEKSDENGCTKAKINPDRGEDFHIKPDFEVTI